MPTNKTSIFLCKFENNFRIIIDSIYDEKDILPDSHFYIFL